jgi:2-polyprenyl-3-methyl-5-hydroxy-6-metoxy-1,4-benzoquinol methylase
LETFEWNYKEDKWEHDTALARIQPGDRVLDVGCGEGNFLLKAQGKGAVTCGIELNKGAAAVAERKGIRVCEELLRDHRVADLYDVVTSFQVLEHVVDPLAFIRDCVGVLRDEGMLIIGVPNNDGFLRLDPENVLNQPPHHMGLWNRASLSALPAMVGLEIVGFEIEPLIETGWYQSVIERRYLRSWRRRLFYRLGYSTMLASYIRENAHTIAGHTIMAIYRKK